MTTSCSKTRKEKKILVIGLAFIFEKSHDSRIFHDISVPCVGVFLL